jgi:methionine biosynthesis protein MetW
MNTHKESVTHVAIRKIIRALTIPLRMLRPVKSACYKVFIQKMPMNDFGSYDGYWDLRSEKRSNILYRFKYVLKRLPEHGKLLDIGCGEGTSLEYVPQHRPNLELIGVDGSGNAVKLTREKGIEARNFVFVVDKFDEHFQADFVVMFEVIEDIPNAEEILRLVGQIARQSVFISIPNTGYFVNRLRLLARRVPVTNVFFHIKEHIRFWTYHDFLYWCSRLGFTVVDIFAQYGTSYLSRSWPSLVASGLVAEIKVPEALFRNYRSMEGGAKKIAK